MRLRHAIGITAVAALTFAATASAHVEISPRPYRQTATPS